MTLDDVREEAQRRLQGWCAVCKVCDGGPTKPCQNHGYGGPVGMGGAGSGSSFANNAKALEAVKLWMSVIGGHRAPETRIALFGHTLAFPILGASVSGVRSFGEAITETELCQATVLGCIDAGTMAFRGDTASYSPDNDPGLEAILDGEGRGVKIFKPRAPEVLRACLRRAEEVGAAAVGVDVDGCGSAAMAMERQPVFRKTAEDIGELVRATKLPFIVKGVMTVEDATAAAEAGAAAVVVSNHGGRVLDHTPGTAEVLPSIASALKGKVTVIADGGIRSGYDALKMLALGARAVLVGRDLVRAAVGGGREGVRLQMQLMGDTLAKAMLMTGCGKLKEIGPGILA